jgi:hypothetical protein
MTFEEFRAAGAEDFDGALLALWWDGQGEWDRAHEVAQEVSGQDGAWVHGYLHRKAGDEGNAAYWYRRAGRAMPRGDMSAEWETVVREILSRNGLV